MSNPISRRGAALALLDFAGRMALPASLLALTRGHTGVAVTVSIGATVLVALRSLMVGATLHSSLLGTWTKTIHAVRQRSVTRLRARREDDESVAALLDSIRHTAEFQGTTVPYLASSILQAIVTAAAVFYFLGLAWIAVGSVAVVAISSIVLLSHRRIRALQRRAYSHYGGLIRDLRTLLDGCAELRANRVEERFVGGLMTHVAGFVHADRNTSMWSAVSNLLPVCVATLAMATPVRAGIVQATETLGGPGIAEIGILGTTALIVTFGLARSIEAALRSAPSRSVLRNLLTDTSTLVATAAIEPSEAGRLFEARIEFRNLAHQYPGGGSVAPAGLEFVWAGRQSIAVVGANGAGKTTLAFMLLGLLEPTEGEIRLDGLRFRDWVAQHGAPSTAYVAQGPFSAPGATIRWHFHVFAEAVSDDAMLSSLDRVRLLPVLARRATRLNVSPLDLLAGDLSGGERQLMHLARALLQTADLLVLDEPEVGLDADARRHLASLLDEIQTHRRVLVIAHDESIIPPTFVRLPCRSSTVTAT